MSIGKVLFSCDETTRLIVVDEVPFQDAIPQVTVHQDALKKRRLHFFALDDGEYASDFVQSEQLFALDVFCFQYLCLVYHRLMVSALACSNALLNSLERVLIIGVGGGSLLSFLTHWNEHLAVDGVEISPEVVLAAEECFGLKPSSRLCLHTIDGSSFLTNCASQKHCYDAILIDADAGYSVIPLQSSVVQPDSVQFLAPPSCMTTMAFLRTVFHCLNEDGVIIFNVVPLSIVHKSMDHRYFQNFLLELKHVFGSVFVITAPQAENSQIVVAIKRNHHPTEEVLDKLLTSEQLLLRVRKLFHSSPTFLLSLDSVDLQISTI